MAGGPGAEVRVGILPVEAAELAPLSSISRSPRRRLVVPLLLLLLLSRHQTKAKKMPATPPRFPLRCRCWTWGPSTRLPREMYALHWGRNQRSPPQTQTQTPCEPTPLQPPSETCSPETRRWQHRRRRHRYPAPRQFRPTLEEDRPCLATSLSSRPSPPLSVAAAAEPVAPAAAWVGPFPPRKPDGVAASDPAGELGRSRMLFDIVGTGKPISVGGGGGGSSSHA